MQTLKTKSNFTRFAKATPRITGQPITFCVAVVIIVLWAATSPLFHFSDTWQLIINTSTTIVTFLMVFLIQNTQNRDVETIQIKLDELIRPMEGAHDAFAGPGRVGRGRSRPRTRRLREIGRIRPDGN